MDAEEILNYFYGQVVFTRTPKGWARPFEAEAYPRHQAGRSRWSTPIPARSWPRPAPS